MVDNHGFVEILTLYDGHIVTTGCRSLSQLFADTSVTVSRVVNLTPWPPSIIMTSYQKPDSVFTWKTILPNFIPIRFETTSFIGFFEEDTQTTTIRTRYPKYRYDISSWSNNAPQISNLHACCIFMFTNQVAALLVWKRLKCDDKSKIRSGGPKKKTNKMTNDMRSVSFVKNT